MTYITRVAATGGALLAAAGLLAAGPAAAATRAHGHGNWLHLTVTRGEADTGAARDALLLCGPPRRDAHSEEACAELAAADGDIGRIPARRVFCPMIYAPVTARAYGRWNGRPVDFQETYANTCTMEARTGAVFELDD
ncbi:MULTISPECIES: SSI family serine proteinase inhibitor [unclassified Streptomyces]|uniref:SSI family serine proteinase inhibitor n=1 Tax=unclassified Streptomyces TaxID=2593676 RepID=UPI004040FC67